MKFRFDCRSFARPSVLRPRRNSDIVCRLGLKDALKLLEINDDCTLEEVKKAYRQKIKLLHPDLGTDQSCEKKTVDLNLAYEVACKGKRNEIYRISDIPYLADVLVGNIVRVFAVNCRAQQKPAKAIFSGRL